MLTELWVRYKIWRVYLITRLREELALETIEWIAMGTVVLILTFAIGAVFTSRGGEIGGAIVDTINGWIKQWGGGPAPES